MENDKNDGDQTFFLALEMAERIALRIHTSHFIHTKTNRLNERARLSGCAHLFVEPITGGCLGSSDDVIS